MDDTLQRLGDGVPTRELLTGGMVSTTVRLRWPDGKSVVVKECDDAPPGMFPAEAAGLRALAAAGCIPVPGVLDVSASRLVLEDLGSAPVTEPAWTTLAHDLARQHLVTADRFGFDVDAYLGRLRQHSPWTDDGADYFARYRMLRYLDEPVTLDVLGADDRARIERLAGRLASIVPEQPASLLHGDLWWANVIGPARPDARPWVIDPACNYGWAEAELSMLWSCGQVPDAFWPAYQEIRPLDDGWKDRMPLLNIREVLSMVAHFGNRYGSVDKLRTLLDRWV